MKPSRTTWVVIAGALVTVACVSCSSDETTDPASDDPGTGTELGGDDPGVVAPDPCVDLDQCPDPVDPDAGAPPALAVGARLLVKTYAPFRKTPSATGALVTSAAPNGGVPDDGVHLWGSPLGYVSPAQIVVLEDATKNAGYYHVTYDGKSGWMLASKLVVIDSKIDPVDFALRASNRNAFFKHQIHRVTWNKDGPSHSGNCAPTSLAMAVRILGSEPSGLSIEESIHRVRLSYSSPVTHDNGPTSRLQIQQAATKLKLSMLALNDAGLSASGALTRIDGQLAKKRLVVLEGKTGDGSGTPSTYQKAMNRAYAAAIKAGQTLYHSTYGFDGYHSILVLGKDGANYVVGDPFSEVGFVVLTPTEMKDFYVRWAGHQGTGTSVWN